jgi:hypothetical protein
MCRACSLIAGFVMAFTLAGCSESAPESGTVPYKPTQSPAIDGFSKQMADTAKGGGAAKKTEPADKPATDNKKAAEAKPEEPKK